jgi:8-oxo-dGTP pyrophosphatase MutT (NUDIX family)
LIEGAPVPPTAPEEIRRLIGRFPESSPPHGVAGAAVTIVLRAGLSDVEVLLIERAVREGDPASGQIGLPGGHAEDDEGALVRTAIRECEEEVGIGAADFVGLPRFVGLAEAPTLGLTVGVFTAELGPAAPGARARDPIEVAHVFWMPKSALRRRRKILRETGSGPREVDATVIDGHVLWGFTRRVLLNFFEIPDEDAPR